jgi:class 3 adenylate cyclase
LPETTAAELKATGKAKAKNYDSVTVLFTDFKNFTAVSEQLNAEQLVAELNKCFMAFDEITDRHNLEKIKTIGDAYMCAGGIPETNSTHPIDAVSAGLEMVKAMIKYQEERIKEGQPIFQVRVGIHTGPLVAGVVGTKKFAYDIWGDTVNTASRMESSGEPDRVNVSEATWELVKDQFEGEHRGKIAAKNKGNIDMYFITEKKNT